MPSVYLGALSEEVSFNKRLKYRVIATANKITILGNQSELNLIHVIGLKRGKTHKVEVDFTVASYWLRE